MMQLATLHIGGMHVLLENCLDDNCVMVAVEKQSSNLRLLGRMDVKTLVMMISKSSRIDYVMI